LLGGELQLDPPRMPLDHLDAGWPVILFSSGLYGSLEMYTQFCRDLASTGAIVIAVEHEDGSGVYATDRDTSAVIHYRPRPDGVDSASFRRPQLEQRSHDLAMLASGVMSAARGIAVPAGNDTSDRALMQVLQQANPELLILSGHSFGATSVVYFFSQAHEQSPFVGVLLLDLWAGPLNTSDVSLTLPNPFALILSDPFYHDPLEVGSRVYTELHDKNWERELAAMYVPGTLHQWISEAPMFAPSWLLRRFSLIGSGSFKATFEPTVRAAALLVEAFLYPSKLPVLNGSLASLKPGILQFSFV